MLLGFVAALSPAAVPQFHVSQYGYPRHSKHELYRHASRPKFILMRMCQPQDSGVITARGRFVHLPDEEVRLKGIDIILQDLKEFPSRDSSPGSEFTGSLEHKRKVRKMLRDYWNVSISLRTGPVLWIDPIVETGRNRGVGYAEDRVVVPLPCSNKNFYEFLCQAYDRCCVVYTR